MRKHTRLFSQVGPEQRLADAITQLPSSAARALTDVADREDLPLVAGSWNDDSAGCLVANVVRLAGDTADESDLTLDVRILDIYPELSSRDLNRLIVAWDEAALQEGRDNDPALRRLLRGALARAGVRSDDVVTAADVQATRLPRAAEPPDADGTVATAGARSPASR